MSQNQPFFPNFSRSATPASQRKKSQQELFEEAREAALQARRRGPAEQASQAEEDDSGDMASPFARAHHAVHSGAASRAPGTVPPRGKDHSEGRSETHSEGPFSPPRDASPVGTGSANRYDSASDWSQRSAGPFTAGYAQSTFSPRSHDETARTNNRDRAGGPSLPSRVGVSSTDPLQKPRKADAVPEAVTPQNAGKVRKASTWSEWLQNVTGFAELSRSERVGLQVLLVATPVLLWVCEYVWAGNSPAANAASESDGGNVGPQRSLANGMGSMTYFDVAVSIMLGVLLSFTFDANTAATDAYIKKLWSAVRSKWRGLAASQQKGSAAATPAPSLSSPAFSRFAVVALLAGYGGKVVASAVHTRVMGFLLVHARSALLVLACGAVLYGAVVGSLTYLRYRRARSGVVSVLATMTKALLMQKGRAYPIPYLLEEVGDALRAAELGLPLSPQPGAQPAVASLFGVAALGSKARAAEEESGASADREGREAPGRDVLQGFALRRLWSDVQRAVQRDSRIQKIDAIVDGKKQPCWRVLTGSTNAQF